ncbi:MAG: ABC transporter permease, partial [Longimicrobiales bacterium]|nr:ABC transporter permease [Longimicrobiales bacterium]
SEAWKVRLTESAIAALRELEPEERRTVARRIDDLASRGLPPAMRDRARAAGTVGLPVGDHLLVCMEDEKDRTLYIVMLGAREEEVPAASMTTVGRRLKRWWNEWMGGDGMGWIAQEVRFAGRSLRRSPGFTAVAMLTLSLGIGATAAIFSVAHGVILSPLPYDDPDEIVTIWASWDNFPDKTWLSVPEFQLFHQENRVFQDMALYTGQAASFTSVENPEQVRGAVVTPNTFDVLGVSPVVGRFPTWDEAEDDVPVVVLSHGIWQRRHGGDPGIVGSDVEIDGSLVTVIGVLPEDFLLPVDFASVVPYEIYRPAFVDLESPAPDLGSGGSHGYYGVGRLAEDATVAQAQADLDRIMAGVEPIGLYSEERRFTPRVFAAKDDVVGTARTTILVLFAAVGFVLLIACGNVANLLLSRSESRGREVAVRAAVGAGRVRILRQLLIENLLLAGVAGILGIGLAQLGLTTLLSIDPEAVPRADNIGLDGTVVAFTVAVSLLTALLFGLIPALKVSRVGLAGTLHQGRRGSGSGPGSSRAQGLLVASQMAMAVILLTGAGLMARTLVSLLDVDPGFGTENVLTVRVSTPSGSYPDSESVTLFYQDLLDRVREIPGVRSAGAARLLPLATTMGDSFFRPVGYQPGPNESTQGDWQWATPGYLETMGIPLVEGRAFDERDIRDGQAVVMVNEVIAQRYWPGESAVGRAVLAGGAADTAVVVGVVGNVSHNELVAAPKTRYYVPHAQVDPNWLGSTRSMTLTIATEGPPGRYLDAVRAEVRALDPSIPLAQVRTLEEVMSASVAQPRFATLLLGAFATIALALAVIGIYGVLAYTVSQRTREIGVRMAMGAEAKQVVGLVVRQGMTMALVGVAVGTGVAWFVTDLLSGMLYQVAPQDPLTFVSVPVLFSLVALAACFVPAARASRVRPANVLRYE